MFWTIPVNREEIITDTPAKARVLRSMYFVNKNGGAFRFGKVPDSITVIVDGTVIANNLFPLPFMTESTNRYHYDWERCALWLNHPIKNSEVKISGLRANDINLMFRYDYDDNDKYVVFKNEVCENRIFRIFEKPDATPPQYHHRLKPIDVKSGVPQWLLLDCIPERVFIYPYYTTMSGEVKILPKEILNCLSVKFLSTNTIIHEHFSAHLLSVTNRLAWRDVDYTFDQQAEKQIGVQIDIAPALASVSEIDGNTVQTIDLAIHFIS